jgi:hypothetical protein
MGPFKQFQHRALLKTPVLASNNMKVVCHPADRNLRQVLQVESKAEQLQNYTLPPSRVVCKYYMSQDLRGLKFYGFYTFRFCSRLSAWNKNFNESESFDLQYNLPIHLGPLICLYLINASSGRHSSKEALHPYPQNCSQ